MSSTEHQANLLPLLVIEADLAPLVTLGPSPGGEVRVVPILGGRVETLSRAGSTLPAFAGTILPGGADWQQVRSDGSLEISARYLLESEAGEKVEVQSNGLRVASPDVLAALGRGELLPASRYYFRTAVRFRTAATRLARLNDLLAVSYGERRASSVRLVVYEVT